METTRTLSSELSPTVLREENLARIFGWLAGHMQERHGLHVELDVQARLLVESRPRRTLLLRITRELLFNVIKHADAERAALRAWTEEGWLLLQASDEGTGLAPEALEEGTGGYGLSDMRERLHFLSGRLKLESAPGEGTRVTIALPHDGKDER